MHASVIKYYYYYYCHKCLNEGNKTLYLPYHELALSSFPTVIRKLCRQKVCLNEFWCTLIKCACTSDRVVQLRFIYLQTKVGN